MIDRAGLLAVLDVIATARREATADLDAARTSQFAVAAVDGARDEQPLQTAGALVRQLENTIRELSDVIRTIDQKARLTKV